MMNLNTALVTMKKKTKSALRAIPYLFHARVQRTVALHDLQKALSLFLAARDGVAEGADEGDASLHKVVHHPWVTGAPASRGDVVPLLPLGRINVEEIVTADRPRGR